MSLPSQGCKAVAAGEHCPPAVSCRASCVGRIRSFLAARSLAEPARGLCATSPAEGMIARRASSAASASRPQPQTGISGGQMQPRARSVRKRFTRRSSSE